MGNPVLVDLHELLDSFNAECLIDLRNAETVVGNVHSCHVLLGTEQLYPAAFGSVSLHALKISLTVVEAHCGRLKRNRAVRNYSCIMPALTLIIVHKEHMVSENFTESQLGFISRLCLRRCCFCDFDLHN